jgi:acyl-CoA synthetase (AMP-forming)/AMP-acid ligase II
MVFYPPKTVPWQPHVPDDVPICDFMFDEKYGRVPLAEARDPFTCGLSGRTYSTLEVRDRVDYLSRALAKEFGWHPKKGTEWDKVIGVFCLNTVSFSLIYDPGDISFLPSLMLAGVNERIVKQIDSLTLFWATHRLAGVVSPANAAYSASELTYQLKDSKAKALFTCLPLLDTALKAAAEAKIPKKRIYLIDLPEQAPGGKKVPSAFKTVSQLIEGGKHLSKVEKIQWGPGQGARTTAFLCYSSGTSGLPVCYTSSLRECRGMMRLIALQKGVMISHRNVISNTTANTLHELGFREELKSPGEKSQYRDIGLGLLPQSHIYALVLLCHVSPYRGDQVVVLPKFELGSYLNAIQKYRIATLYLVRLFIYETTCIFCTLVLNLQRCRYHQSSLLCSAILKPVANMISAASKHCSRGLRL